MQEHWRRRSGKKERGDETPVYHQKLVEKLVWVPLIYFRFVKFHSPVMRLMPYYAKTGNPLIA
jgi:hypothetical protein